MILLVDFKVNFLKAKYSIRGAI